jgi:hypothetical protein
MEVRGMTDVGRIESPSMLFKQTIIMDLFTGKIITNVKTSAVFTISNYLGFIPVFLYRVSNPLIFKGVVI